MGRGPTWSPSDVLHLRWYAERGFSLSETAKVMDRTTDAVASKASELQIKFHGPAGAPFLNDNAWKWRLRQTINAKKPRMRNRRRTGTRAVAKGGD